MSTYPPVAGPDITSDATLVALLAQLQTRFRGSICCTLVYGSCLRSGDIYDGLLDLYLICDSYRAAYGFSLPAAANWLLPPNVFYAEQNSATGGKTLRSKVTVISLRDFQRGCSSARFESYIWGRFAQPTRILFARDDQLRTQIQAALTDAARTLLRRAVPALPPEGTLASLWEQALILSYATELRTERSGRAQELVQSSLDFYTALTGHLAGQLGFTLELVQRDGEWHYRSAMVNRKRHTASVAWVLRRGQGKLLSILRLVKALFTFAGGLDYIAWKLERHSGVKIEIPDKVRRAPLIHLWGFFWGLYRRGPNTAAKSCPRATARGYARQPVGTGAHPELRHRIAHGAQRPGAGAGAILPGLLYRP
ncbi:MAG TPA: hypothetical protein VIV27_01675, partial [Halioglobus sp.]